MSKHKIHTYGLFKIVSITNKGEMEVVVGK